MSVVLSVLTDPGAPWDGGTLLLVRLLFSQLHLTAMRVLGGGGGVLDSVNKPSAKLKNRGVEC